MTSDPVARRKISKFVGANIPGIHVGGNIHKQKYAPTQRLHRLERTHEEVSKLPSLQMALNMRYGTIQMTKPYDFYKTAEQIGRQLVVDGLGEWKARIDDAITAGSTGTEILMALRWTFGQLQSATVSCEVKSQISEFNQHLADLGI